MNRTTSHRLAVVRFAAAWLAHVCLGLIATGFGAEDERPNYLELRLESLFPAGGQIGTSVDVEFRTLSTGVFDAKRILVDGPPGITVGEVKQDRQAIRATLTIARDAVPGKRELRVLGTRAGLTNMLYFSVGTLPEVLEVASESAQTVSLPCVINGRIDPATDVDTFVFTAKRGQRINAFAAAQAIDSHGQYKDYGFVDLNLRLRDSQGRVLAEARDSIGLDPLITWQAPADGQYSIQVDHVLFRGYSQAVYRLVLGEAPLATSAFPPGLQRGTTKTLRLAGPLFEGLDVSVSAANANGNANGNDKLPWSFVSHPVKAGDVEVPIVIGDLPEANEVEGNNTKERATRMTLSSTMNARFDEAGDEDWFQLTVPVAGPVEVSTMAQRFLRSPVDTSLVVFDSRGKKVAENDDGFPIEYMSLHDFEPPDSRLTFNAPATGDYFIQVRDHSGQTGPRAVFRLTARPAVPDFELQTYPDAVPIWGPGSTAGVVVKVIRHHGFAGDIELAIEGLPTGWTGSRATNLVHTPERPPSSYYNHFALRTFLTITAPADSKPTDLAEFRIVGRATRDGQPMEREAQSLTWYYSSDIGFFRQSRKLRAAVAQARRPWLSATTTRFSGRIGDRIEVPVTIHEGSDLTSIVLVPSLATAGVATAYNAPSTVTIQNGQAMLPITITPETPIGKFYLTISRSWGSDIRVGMPGPCTPLLELEVKR